MADVTETNKTVAETRYPAQLCPNVLDNFHGYITSIFISRLLYKLHDNLTKEKKLAMSTHNGANTKVMEIFPVFD